jgi:hypothetical protein
MLYARFFLPQHQVVHKRVTSTSLNLGSGSKILFFGFDFLMVYERFCRSYNLGLLLGFRPLGSILGATLVATVHTAGIQCTTNNVIPYPRQILHPAPADQYDGVLLKVVTFTRDVSVYFLTVGKPYPGYLSHGRVRLLGSGGINPYTNTATLGT